MRVVVLLSGSGTNFQAVLDAVGSGQLPINVVAVGSDVPDVGGLKRAQDAGIEAFVIDWAEYRNRTTWTTALKNTVDSYAPDLVVSSGLMRIVGPEFIDAYADQFINTHPALLPAFPGAHAVRDALAYGVKVTGCTVHQVDAGVDTGPILAQRAVDVLPGDTEETLHERIKKEERALLIEVLAQRAADHAPMPGSSSKS